MWSKLGVLRDMFFFFWNVEWVGEKSVTEGEMTQMRGGEKEGPKYVSP